MKDTCCSTQDSLGSNVIFMRDNGDIYVEKLTGVRGDIVIRTDTRFINDPVVVFRLNMPKTTMMGVDVYVEVTPVVDVGGRVSF